MFKSRGSIREITEWEKMFTIFDIESTSDIQVTPGIYNYINKGMRKKKIGKKAKVNKHFVKCNQIDEMNKNICSVSSDIMDMMQIKTTVSYH